MGILDNLYKHSMVHPDVANAYIDGKDVPEIILKNEVPNPEFLEAIGEIGTKYADITLVQTGNGTISADSTHIALPGKVTLTATPNAYYEISKWQVSTDGTTWTDVQDATSTTLEYNLTEPGTYGFKAIFSRIQLTATVITSVNDSSYGSATGGGTYQFSAGTSEYVYLSANANAGYKFSKWQSSTDGSAWSDMSVESDCTVTIIAAGTYYYKAVFEEIVQISVEMELCVEQNGTSWTGEESSGLWNDSGKLRINNDEDWLSNHDFPDEWTYSSSSGYDTYTKQVTLENDIKIGYSDLAVRCNGNVYITTSSDPDNPQYIGYFNGYDETQTILPQNTIKIKISGLFEFNE